MENPETRVVPQFYFALPRLLASQFGRSVERTEANWLEATIVGTIEHLLWYLFAMHVLLGGLPFWGKIALVIPVAFLVWICWLIALYLDSVLIGSLRRFGFLRDLSNARAQSVLLGILTTAFALHLVVYGSWWSWLAIIWVASVALNLLAAAVLVVGEAINPASE
jgi:hypothetical protein